LDSAPIRESIPCLLGERVFKAFSKPNPEEEHYLCDVKEARWEEFEREYHFTITANRFLHNMVRILTGTLVDMGRGRLQPSDMYRILDSGDRQKAGMTVPARGLFLVSVAYKEHNT
jgi:tRNA pseudouridine38-40 synthase